jgi:hypothetical protein
MWLQALQSNFQQAPSSFDCQEPKPSPWNIITIITVISLYQGCWPSNRSVEPHTYLAISAHIEHNPGKFPSFPVPFAFLPCIRILQTDGVPLLSTLQQAHSLACIKSFRKALHTRIISSLRSPVSSPPDVKLRSSPLVDFPRKIDRKSWYFHLK